MSLNDDNVGDGPSSNFAAVELVAEAGHNLLIPDGKWILKGEFSRVGADLIIKDISKLCSLKINEVEFFLNEINLNSEIEIDVNSCLNKNLMQLGSSI